MYRRKQSPKEKTEQVSEVTPAITFALLSVSLTDAQGTNILAQLAAAAYTKFEQQKLWQQAEVLFQTDMGCLGRLIRVHGDLQPAASYLIFAPGVKLMPNVLVAAQDFMKVCSSFHTLQVHLQLGRSAVIDSTGR